MKLLLGYAGWNAPIPLLHALKTIFVWKGVFRVNPLSDRAKE